jgi:S-formylglutathione hydrolase FrmB
MARLRCDIYSDVLGLSVSLTVLLPQRTSTQIGLYGPARAADPPTLYLLHGLSDDDTAWTRYTSIERYAAERGLAVVMPQVHRSCYTDEAHGNRFWTFISQELPETVHGFFRLAQHRNETFVAGLSMGGYGAIRWALREPDRFGAAASLSGALDMAALGHNTAWREQVGPLWENIFGERDITGSGDDLLTLLERADPAGLPPFYLACGTGDRLYPHTVRFAAACQERGLSPTVECGPGEHEWSYWDAKIRDVLAWLPL